MAFRDGRAGRLISTAVFDRVLSDGSVGVRRYAGRYGALIAGRDRRSSFPAAPPVDIQDPEERVAQHRGAHRANSPTASTAATSPLAGPLGVLPLCAAEMAAKAAVAERSA